MKLSKRKKICFYDDENIEIASIEYSIRYSIECKSIHIFNLFVKENKRRNGVGSEFITQSIEMFIKDYSPDKITSDYLLSDLNAEKFWLSNNFIKVNSYSKYSQIIKYNF